MNRLKTIERGGIVREKILLALAGYKFLTASHMKSLGLASDNSYLRKKAKERIDRPKPLIGVRRFASDPKRGGRENFYFLTRHGVKALMKNFKMEEEDILYPKGGLWAVFESQYFHRKAIIQFQIYLETWAHQNQIDIPFFYRDFDTTGNNRKNGSLQSQTKIQLTTDRFIKPDALFMLSGLSSPNSKDLFLFEIYDGDDAGWVIKKLKKHGEAIGIGTPSLKYDLQKAHRILVVFENESLMHVVIDRVKKLPFFSQILDFFLFKSLSNMKAGVNFGNWQFPNGEYYCFC